MPIKRCGVVLLEPRGGGDNRNLLLGVWEPPQENFEIGVLKSAFQCISSNHGFCSFVKEKQFHREKHTCKVLC